jgi:CubicO group peptidase (beta-lactamase class C family)
VIAQLPGAEEMGERLAMWAERYKVPGASIAWMHGDEVQSAGAGVTNIETQVPVTPDTLFQIGSITKVYTTTLIMQLVEEGRVALDTPAVQYLPDLKFGDATESVTIRHLLTHTSGVDGDFFDDFGRGDGAVARYVEASAKLKQVFPVGAMWSYCNAGFVVLGRIIETLTEKTWDAALKERLLDKIGATNTVTLPEEAILHTTSVGHNVTPKLEVTVARPWNMARAAGPAGATPCSTVEDLLKFARMHVDGGVARDDKRVISEESVREMQRPQVTLPASPGDGAAHWGLGWMLFDWGGRRVIGHDGGTIGQQSSLRILPEEKFAVAVLTNSLGGGLLAQRIMHWLFAQTLGIEMPPRAQPPESPPQLDLAPYAGVYDREGLRTTIRLQDGQLVAESKNTMASAANTPQLPPSRLFPVDESLFLQHDPWGRYVPVVFSEFDGGRPRYMFASRVARRVEDAAP